MAALPEVHKEAIVIAGHTDIIAADVGIWRAGGHAAVFETRHVPTLRSGGVTAVCEHLGGDTRYGFLPASGFHSSPLQRALRMFDDAHLESEESASILIAFTLDDIIRAKREDKIALILCIEGGAVLEGELAYLRNFHRLGLRSLGLTHNFRNSLADGFLERSGGGLTYFGIDVVKECNAVGIIVDVSHLSDRGIEDVLKTSSRPIRASHSNARAVHPHSRNLTDEQIKGIAAGGGVIGIHALNSLICANESPTLDDLLRHIVHIAEIGGIDCVGIGPDLLENWQPDKLKAVNEGSSKFTSVPFTPPNFTYPTELNSLAQLGNLTTGLKSAGFGDEDVKKILGGNLLRLFSQVM